MIQLTKEEFFQGANEAREKFRENYNDKDILDYYVNDLWIFPHVREDAYASERYKYVDYFLFYFPCPDTINFDLWGESGDAFCYYHSETLERKQVIIDADVYLESDDWETFVNSLWELQQEAYRLESRIIMQ